MATIKTDLEANIIAAHVPNIIVLENVSNFLDFTWTMVMANNVSATFSFVPDANGEVEINLLEITSIIYQNLANYTDPFDYSATVIYTQADPYHYAVLQLSFEDSTGVLPHGDVAVINGAFQIKECITYPIFIGQELGSENPPRDLDLLNFDLNANLVS